MIYSPYILPAVLALTVVSLSVLRARSIAAKLSCESLILALLGGCLLMRGTSPLPSHLALSRAPDAAWLKTIAVVWWLVGARVVATLTILALGRDARSRAAKLLSDLLAGAIYLTAMLIILDSVLNLRVYGLLATSGVMAIVLGLALQNTLADVFSGIAVGIEKPFRVGERVSIGDHPEGTVVEMNWRAIRIQTDGEDVATIPNSIVARSGIINRSVPTERRATSVDIPTRSTARSETLIELVRQATLLCPAILERPEVAVSIKQIASRATTLGVSYHVASTVDLASARHQLLRQVRRLFRHANIEGEGPLTRATLLADLILFESLTHEQIDGLSKALISHVYSVGDAIFEQDSLGASLFIVASGVFEVARIEGEAQTIYGRVGPGEYLGEISMLSGEPRRVTATALASGSTFELPRSAIQILLGKDEAIGAAFTRSVQRGLALLDRDTAARISQPLEAGGSLLGRIQGFLHPARA